MASRKKTSLSDALEDLKHLPRVLKALAVLNGEQEKVRALMGHGIGMDFRGAHPMREWAPGRMPVDTCPGIPRSPMPPGPAVLDTPERREYEAARKAGKVVADPFAGISAAQRERMEEQRALVERLRASRGAPPVPTAPVPVEQGAPVVVVGTEELEQSANGSAGAEVESGGFTDG